MDRKCKRGFNCMSEKPFSIAIEYFDTKTINLCEDLLAILTNLRWFYQIQLCCRGISNKNKINNGEN